MQTIKFGTFITVYNNYNNNFCSFINYYIEQLIDTKNKDMDDIIVSFDNYTTSIKKYTESKIYSDDIVISRKKVNAVPTYIMKLNTSYIYASDIENRLYANDFFSQNNINISQFDCLYCNLLEKNDIIFGIRKIKNNKYLFGYNPDKITRDEIIIYFTYILQN